MVIWRPTHTQWSVVSQWSVVVSAGVLQGNVIVVIVITPSSEWIVHHINIRPINGAISLRVLFDCNDTNRQTNRQTERDTERERERRVCDDRSSNTSSKSRVRPSRQGYAAESACDTTHTHTHTRRRTILLSLLEMCPNRFFFVPNPSHSHPAIILCAKSRLQQIVIKVVRLIFQVLTLVSFSSAQLATKLKHYKHLNGSKKTVTVSGCSATYWPYCKTEQGLCLRCVSAVFYPTLAS